MYDLEAFRADLRGEHLPEDIQSPKDIGDDAKEYPLNEKYLLRVGFFSNQFYIRLYELKEKKVLCEWLADENPCNKKNTEKEVVERLCILELDKGEAKKKVATIFMNAFSFLEKFGNTKPSTRKHSSSEDNLLFSKTHLNKSLRPAIGILETRNSELTKHYYFGMMIPTRKPKVNEEGEIIGTEIKPSLVFILDDYNHHSATENFKEQNKITLRGELTNDNPRWTLEKIERYLTSKEFAKPATPLELFEKIKAQYKKTHLLRRRSTLRHLANMGNRDIPL